MILRLATSGRGCLINSRAGTGDRVADAGVHRKGAGRPGSPPPGCRSRYRRRSGTSPESGTRSSASSVTVNDETNIDRVPTPNPQPPTKRRFCRTITSRPATTSITVASKATQIGRAAEDRLKLVPRPGVSSRCPSPLFMGSSGGGVSHPPGSAGRTATTRPVDRIRIRGPVHPADPPDQPARRPCPRAAVRARASSAAARSVRPSGSGCRGLRLHP